MLDMKFAIITFVLLFTTLVNSQEPLAGGVRYEHLKIPMRDGIHLSAHAFFPTGKGPWPVSVSYTHLTLPTIYSV